MKILGPQGVPGKKQRFVQQKTPRDLYCSTFYSFRFGWITGITGTPRHFFYLFINSQVKGQIVRFWFIYYSLLNITEILLRRLEMQYNLRNVTGKDHGKDSGLNTTLIKVTQPRYCCKDQSLNNLNRIYRDNYDYYL